MCFIEMEADTSMFEISGTVVEARPILKSVFNGGRCCQFHQISWHYMTVELSAFSMAEVLRSNEVCEVSSSLIRCFLPYIWSTSYYCSPNHVPLNILWSLSFHLEWLFSDFPIYFGTNIFLGNPRNRLVSGANHFRIFEHWQVVLENKVHMRLLI